MNTFPLRRIDPVPRSFRELAELLEISPHDSGPELRGVAPLATAQPDQIGFLAHRHYLPDFEGTRAGALLIAREMVELLPEASEDLPKLVVDDPHDALARLLETFHPRLERAPEIHSTAILGHGVRIGHEVRIGPYAVIEAEAVLGDRCGVGAHAVVGARSALGDDVLLHPHAVVYPDTEVGDRVVLQAGARAGVEGFGWVFRPQGHEKIPQVGRCVIESDVEVGANTTIDRGSIGETRVSRGAKLDNLVHIGHNVFIGTGSVLAAQVGIAGSATLEAGVMAGGQAGIGGHLTVGKGAQLGGQAGIIGDIPAGETVVGYPARPRGEFLRGAAAQRKVPELLKRVRELEKRLARLEDASES